MLKILFRFIALPILVLFVLAFPFSLVMRNLGALIFDAETTKTFVRESLLSSELASSLARQGAEQILSSDEGGKEISTALFAQLTEEDWRQITEIIAPEALVSETVDSAIDAFTDWLDTPDAPFPDLNVELTGWKASTIQNAGGLVAVFLDALPACGQSELTALANEGVTARSASLPVCRPPEPYYSAIIASAGPLMEAVISRSPNSIELKQLTGGAEAPKELVELKSNLVQLRFWLAWGWVAVLAIGLAAAGLAGSGLIGFLKWAGWPLLVAGIVTLTLGLAVFIFNFNFLETLFGTFEGSQAFGILAGAVASGALPLVGAPLLLQGLASIALALAALLYARALQRRLTSPGIPINRRRIRL